MECSIYSILYAERHTALGEISCPMICFYVVLIEDSLVTDLVLVPLLISNHLLDFFYSNTICKI